MNAKDYLKKKERKEKSSAKNCWTILWATP